MYINTNTIKMEIIKLTKSQKFNLQNLLNAYHQDRKISEQRGSDYYSYKFGCKFSLRRSANDYAVSFKLSVTGWKPLKQFFILEKNYSTGPSDISGLDHRRLILVDGIGDMIKEAVELQQNIHKAELKMYDEQISLLNNIIGKYQLWNHNLKVASYKEISSRNFFHGLFSQEDRNHIESLNSFLAGKRVEVRLS